MPQQPVPEPHNDVVQVAVQSPFRHGLDYLAPLDRTLADCQPGQRCVVPLGRGTRAGVILGRGPSDYDHRKLKPIDTLLDNGPVFDDTTLRLLTWAADYYQHSVGDACETALPTTLRRPQSAQSAQQEFWEAVDRQVATPTNAPQQAQLLVQLMATEDALSVDQLMANTDHSNRDRIRRALLALEKKSLVQRTHRPALPVLSRPDLTAPKPSDEQQQTIESIQTSFGTFACHLIDGITGSGKTEIYLRLIEQTIARGEQALLLTPEIGLTPQLIERCHRRLTGRIVTLHSGLADGARAQHWLWASQGHADLIIGTRSAIFTPMPRLGLIMIDEEHDGSYKQQDGFRYSARDLAVVRARFADCPVVLGSATPSLESLLNAKQQRYTEHRLTQRAANAQSPDVRLLDIGQHTTNAGLSEPLLKAIKQELRAGNQCLLFINRRGYAPSLICHACGWNAGCRHCDAKLTLHRGKRRLVCHHCGYEQASIQRCPDCNSIDLSTQGQGTEQLELTLKERFADVPILRIDRDTTSRRNALEDLLNEAANAGPAILVGTQMLAKGHHLPGITLVGIIDADQGLYSTDFRATERLGQLIVQVAGRAGRAERPGKVLIQTHFPEHPLFQTLLRNGYRHFAAEIMAERRAGGFPPATHAALIRAEAANVNEARQFLQRARDSCPTTPGIQLLGPAPAPLERRAGRHRLQLLLLCNDRQTRQQLLAQWVAAIERIRRSRALRWSIDVDPQDMA